MIFNTNAVHDFTSEAVSAGHPDKVCDQISDAILDACLSRDPKARVACETMAMKNCVIVAGESTMRSDCELSRDEIEEIVRETVRGIGYRDDDFRWDKLEIINRMVGQSGEIANGVDREDGAGDQGLMFGYATNEVPKTYMPAAIHYAHEILRRLAPFSEDKTDPLGPDAKSQVTLRYQGNKPVAVQKVVVSVQHTKGQSPPEIRRCEVRARVEPLVRALFAEAKLELPEDPCFLLVNPSGSFTRGGPAVDSGLTGRKIIVDTYGGAAPHGGGAFSGKDPTKVDRSGAYAARYLAKNVVAAGLADACLIQVSYAIGIAEPCSFFLNLEKPIDPSASWQAALAQALLDELSMRPREIRDHLQLNKPIYKSSASGGHFGRTPTECGEFSWEKTDLAQKLQTQFRAR